MKKGELTVENIVIIILVLFGLVVIIALLVNSSDSQLASSNRLIDGFKNKIG